MAAGEQGGDEHKAVGGTRPLRTSVVMRTVTYGASPRRVLWTPVNSCSSTVRARVLQSCAARLPTHARRSLRLCVVVAQRLRAARGRSGSALNARDGQAKEQPRALRHTAASLASWVCHCVGEKKVGSPAEDVHPWKLNTGWRRRRVIPAKRTSSRGCQEAPQRPRRTHP